VRFIPLATLLLGLRTLAATVGDPGERPDACSIVTGAFVDVLPAELGPFFGANRVAIARRACDSGDRRSAAQLAGCGGRDGPARIPRDAAGAEAYFAAAGLSRAEAMPWAIEREFTTLLEAFQAAESDRIIDRAGRLLRLAADAAVPMPAAVVEEEEAAGLLWASKCLGRLHGRLAFEVRVAPQRYRTIEDPLGAALAFTSDSCVALAELSLLAANPMQTERRDEGTTARPADDAFDDAALERASGLLESRLEAAALLAANLIGTAWESAGRPALRHERRAEPTEPARVNPERPSNAAAFVGSRGSTVFHRASCAHARRIKADNLVRFPSASAALSAGRSGCRACQPERP
jgi:hypothetical protein